jgi:IS30 family transposase
MKNSYTHLTQEERYHISTQRKIGTSISMIARELNRNKSTISRELKRNKETQDTLRFRLTKMRSSIQSQRY